MKKSIIFIAIILVGFACSPYSIKKERKINSVLSQLKSSGVIIRVPSGAMLKIDDYIKTLSFWLEGYTHKNTLEMIKPTNESIFYSFSDYDRFYQMSTQDKFLTYKSIGVISIFLRQNKEELRKIMTEQKMDSLIIFEIDSSYTLEMQFYDFDTTLVVVDSNFNVAYLDHQSNVYDIDELDNELIRRDLIDKICERFIKSMFELDYISRRKDSIQPQMKSKVIKEEKKEEVKPAEAVKPADEKKEPLPVSGEKPAAEPVVKPEEKKADESAGVKSEIPLKTEKPADGNKEAEPDQKAKNDSGGKSAGPAKEGSDVKNTDDPKPAEATPASLPDKK